VPCLITPDGLRVAPSARRSGHSSTPTSATASATWWPDANGVRLPRTDALGPRERCALGFAVHGDSNKLIAIAYELGMSASTVGVLLHRAARKLRCGTESNCFGGSGSYWRRRLPAHRGPIPH